MLKKYIECFYIYEGKSNSVFSYVAFPHFNTGLSFFKGASIHRQKWSLQISENTIADLSKLGISAPTSAQPDELFSIESLFTLKGFLILAVGGLLVGFGSRYAGGCTSGHAISGLSDLQLPSLIAVIGFFIGGLLMTFVLLPLIL